MRNDDLHAPVVATNISDAWVEVLGRLVQPGVSEMTPSLVTIEGLTNSLEEAYPPARERLDRALPRVGKNRDTNEVANTIFPLSLWNRAAPRTLLYERFLRRVWPSIRHVAANRRGNYFYRMVRFVDDEGSEGINQLEHVIETWTERHNHRHSALQISIFDPLRDHLHSKQLGFPCLHQVSFTPHGTNGDEGMSVTGYYATQHVVTRAYGNYLGLIRLGQFMASAMGLELRRMNCIAAKLELGVPKAVAKSVYYAIPSRNM